MFSDYTNEQISLLEKCGFQFDFSEPTLKIVKFPEGWVETGTHNGKECYGYLCAGYWVSKIASWSQETSRAEAAIEIFSTLKYGEVEDRKDGDPIIRFDAEK